MLGAGYASSGFAALVGAAPDKGCCAGCDDAEHHGMKTPCELAAERAALIAGVTDELKLAKWFLDNRMLIMGSCFAAGGIFFATVAYFVNRKP